MTINSWGGLSGTISVPHLTEYIRTQAAETQGFAQCTVPPPHGYSIGKNRGDTVQCTYFKKLTTTGGELVENERMKTGSIPAVTTNYKIKEYGNGFTYSERLELFASLPVTDGFMSMLVDNLNELQNRLAYAQFAATQWKVAFGLNVANNEFKQGSALTVTAASDLSRDNLRYVVLKAKQNNIPFFDGESYVYVSGCASIDQLRYDDKIQTPLREDSGRAALNGEVGRIVECRLVEDNHAITRIASNSFDEGFLIGADAVLTDWAMPPEIRAEDTDKGRSTDVVYIFYAAWHKTLNHTDHAQEHVIRVHSA